jgi:hypothetical protein
MAAPLTLPGPVADVCAELATIAGVSAVTIGGSRATGSADEASDWDEKHMVERAGLGGLRTRFGSVGASAAAVTAWVEALRESL